MFYCLNTGILLLKNSPVSLVEFVTDHFFVALKIGTAWLSEHVSLWDQIPAFQKLARFARNMPLSNAAAERMLKRTVDFANYGARGEEDFQAVLQTVGASIQRVPSRKTKKASAKAYGHSK